MPLMTLRISRLCVAALLLSIAASTAVSAREPGKVKLTTQATPLALRWIRRDRDQELQHRVAIAGKVPPHLRWLSSALWLESARPGFSVDMDRDDEAIILKYRSKF